MESKDLTTNKFSKQSASFTYGFTTAKTPDQVFNFLLDVKKWWIGLYDETISGASKKLNDEFSFRAGNGAHNTLQRLIESDPDKRIVWLVIESKLTFLKDHEEWVGTKICFDIDRKGNETKVTFTHEGLLPKIECFEECSDAWTRYLVQLEEKLNGHA